jgi:hypothetical protein
MTNIRFGSALLVALLGAANTAAIHAQALLPQVTVTEHAHEESHGGYQISGNFHVDEKMHAVIFPVEAFQANDIINVQIVQMLHDEYFVLQECVSADCTQAEITRVWVPGGALSVTIHDPFRLWIQHEGKYFFWLQKFPMPQSNDADGIPYQFTSYQKFSPPLVLNPQGSADVMHAVDIPAAQAAGPTPVSRTEFEGASFVATFTSGTTIRVKRLRPQN